MWGKPRPFACSVFFKVRSIQGYYRDTTLYRESSFHKCSVSQVTQGPTYLVDCGGDEAGRSHRPLHGTVRERGAHGRGRDQRGPVYGCGRHDARLTRHAHGACMIHHVVQSEGCTHAARVGGEALVDRSQFRAVGHGKVWGLGVG